jgi:conjugal transfer pilus assembly protein TraV
VPRCCSAVAIHCSTRPAGQVSFRGTDPNNPSEVVDGITCKTPFAVQASTNGELPVRQSDLPVGVTLADYEAEQGNVGQRTKQAGSDSTALIKGALMRQSYELPPGLPESDQPNYGRPVRMPAMQMRIWFAPYVDSNDDLHFPSKVYTEVQPRGWAFGEQEFAGKGVIVPTKQLAEVPASPIQRNEPAPDAALDSYNRINQPGKGARCRTCREEIRTIQL